MLRARKLTEDEAYAMIKERAEDIARPPFFAKTVMERGLKIEEALKEFGYKMAIATLFSMGNK